MNYLGELKQSKEVSKIYKYFKSSFVLLRNPPQKILLKKTADLLHSSSSDKKYIDADAVKEISAIFRKKKSYKEFLEHPFNKMLLEKLSDSPDNPQHFSLFHLAVAKQDFFMLGKFISKNLIPLTVEDGCERTPLHIASIYSKPKVVDLLLADRENHKEQLTAIDTDGNTALHLACKHNQANIAGKLIAKGAEIDVINSDGLKPIHYALWNKHKDTVKLLEQEGANLNDLINGETILSLAYGLAYNGKIVINKEKEGLVNYLIKRNLSLDTISADGQTILHKACSDGNRALVKKLLYRKAKVDIENEDGKTPLDIACNNGFHSIARMLLKAGSDVDHALNENNFIDKAYYNNNLKLEKLLIKFDAHIKIEEKLDVEIILNVAEVDVKKLDVGIILNVAEVDVKNLDVEILGVDVVDVELMSNLVYGMIRQRSYLIALVLIHRLQTAHY